MHTKTAALTSGALFGAALTLSGVSAPQVIINQLNFTDFHMLLTFLAASASSAPIFALANHTKFASIACKKNSSFGWAGRFDGNVAGSLLMGVGMGLTGACPGTVIVQAAAGVGSSSALLVSGLLGAIAFVKWNQSHRMIDVGKNSKHTISEATGISTRSLLLSYETALLSGILAASLLAPRSPYLLHPVLGGILIGLAQMSSVVLAKKPLGVSTAYEDVGKMVWGFAEGKSTPGIENVVFVGGMFAGARLTMQLVPETLQVFSQTTSIPGLSTILGGFALIFGSRMAGGCTSGHGISGMSSMGISSFVSVPCMFAGGIVAALLT